MAGGCSSTCIQDLFGTDHRELEDMFARLLAAFDAHNRGAVASLWNDFDTHLSRHLEAEEHFMIPQLSRSNPRAARSLLEEHRYIRSRLIELGFGVDLHMVRPETARGFVDELRAHARHEEKVLYQWANENLPACHYRSSIVALTPHSPVKAQTAADERSERLHEQCLKGGD